MNRSQFAKTTEPDTMSGQLLDSSYLLKERLGRGGTGDVYRAEQVDTGESVVVKVVPLKRSSSKGLRARLKHEAYCLRRLRSHPNVVELFELGVDGKRAYLAMEYIDGESLNELLMRVGALDFESFLEVAEQIVTALVHIHGRGIVHRDVRPENVMLRSDGVVKLIDFDLAKTPGSTIQHSGHSLIGTASYVAPELVRAKEATPASDMYSLGALFYLLLTGEKMVGGDDTASVLAHHISFSPVPLSLRVDDDVPDAFCDLVQACVIKNPTDRPSSQECADWVKDFRADPETPFRELEREPALAVLQRHSGTQISPMVAGVVVLAGATAVIALVIALSGFMGV